MTQEKLFVARIIRDATGEVVRESKPMGERAAGKLADGMGINLNWADYSTEVVEYQPKGRAKKA